MQLEPQRGCRGVQGHAQGSQSQGQGRAPQGPGTAGVAQSGQDRWEMTLLKLPLTHAC